MPSSTVPQDDKNIGYDKSKDKAIERAITIWECIAFGAIALFAVSVVYFFLNVAIPSIKGGSPGADYHPVGELSGGMGISLGPVDAFGPMPISSLSTIL
jgi:hypothetical protein